MRFAIANWNIGGAKFLKSGRSQREETKRKLNSALKHMIRRCEFPDVVTLQEIVRYKEPGDPKVNDLIEPIDGYAYFPFELISTDLYSSRAKWNEVHKVSEWEVGTFFAQGNAFLVKKSARMFPIWDLSDLSQDPVWNENDHFVENVHLHSGLYFGDRNTEPRAASVMHFIENDPDDNSRRPVDIFVVNLHLTTLIKEREGVPEVDAGASCTRLAQLDIVLNGIISRYNSWKQDGYPQRGEKRLPEPCEDFNRHSPVWIIAGDFNFTENSPEYDLITRHNFIDTVTPARKKTQWGVGTKARGEGKPPVLTVDYIFAGPKFVSLDPVIADVGLGGNKVMHDKEFRASDHYPLFATIEFTPS